MSRFRKAATVTETEGHEAAQPDIAAQAAADAGAADAAFGLNPLVGFGSADMIAAFRDITLQAMKDPWPLAQQHAAFIGKLGTAWLGKSDLAPKPGDKRFADPIWGSNPFYHGLKQAYLSWAEALVTWTDRAGFDQMNEPRVRMALSLLADAAAPTNTWLGNPAAIRKLFETGGASAVHGFKHMLGDIAGNGGMPAQVDKTAFRVGGNLALSPGAVVFRNEVLEIMQYAPGTGQVHRRPLLIVPPQINKFYLFDMAPGRSLIEFLTASGLQTFALSWRNPTAEQRHWDLESYVGALIDAIDAIREITGSDDINLSAACSGGITAAMLLGHLAARGDRRINAATLMVTVLDTSAESQLGQMATQETIEAARLSSRQKGVLTGEDLARIFAWMRPNDLVWNYWVNNYLLGNEPPAFDILYWNNDMTWLPAALHSDYLDLFLNNPLRRPGALRLLGTPIDLSKVGCDTFVLAGMTDHITPWHACYATMGMLGGAKEFVLSSSGHIQSIINPPGNPKAKFYRNPQSAPDPAAWLAAAQVQTGSWWSYWRDWLIARAGEQKPAPPTLGSQRHLPGAKAPGTYIFER